MLSKLGHVSKASHCKKKVIAEKSNGIQHFPKGMLVIRQDSDAILSPI